MKVKILVALVVLSGNLAFSCASKQLAERKAPDYDAIIVGAGLGGLTTGAQLAQSGLKVLVLEQRYKVGGCTSCFSRGEFKFDAAIHQLSLGAGSGQVRDILRDLGALDKVELIQAPELARSIFPDIDFTTPTSVKETVSKLKARWPDEAQDIDAFYRLAGDISDEMLSLTELYRKNSFVRQMYKLLVPFSQPNLFKWRNATLDDVFKKYFNDKRLEAIIAQYWVYFGPPPSRIWSPMFLTAYYSYLANGAWQVRGSSQALSNALADCIGESGGVVRTGVRVEKIDVENGSVKGVVTSSGESITSRYVISNADPFQTFHKLIPKADAPEEIIELISVLKPSNSLVGIYLGLDVEPSYFGIREYEIFFNTSLNTDAMYEAMMQGRFDEGAISMTFYSNIGDRFYAPPGKSVLVLNAYSSADYWKVPHTEYLARKARMEEQLLDLAEKIMPGLRKHIQVREGMTPYTIERLTQHKGGVPYGWDMVPEHYERLSNETPIEGLYLAGSWAGMIHGASGAIISGSRAARLILDKEEID